MTLQQRAYWAKFRTLFLDGDSDILDRYFLLYDVLENDISCIPRRFLYILFVPDLLIIIYGHWHGLSRISDASCHVTPCA